MALATVVRTRGSSYRRPGARMLISGNGDTAGSLSGGCLEEEVVQHAHETMATGEPRLVFFDTRLRFGCNGAIEVLVERLENDRGFLPALEEAQRSRKVMVAATVFESGGEIERGTYVLQPDIAQHAFSANAFDWALGAQETRVQIQDGFSSLIHSIQPAIRLLIVGEGPDTIPLAKFSHELGWQVVSHADTLTGIEAIYPDERTIAIIGTHNYGKDFSALKELMPLGLKYVGILGPKKRKEQLMGDLIDSGIDHCGFANLYGPAGLDLGAETPEEIALSIIAEVQSVMAGRSGHFLRDRRGPIHAPLVQSADRSDPIPVRGSI